MGWPQEAPGLHSGPQCHLPLSRSLTAYAWVPGESPPTPTLVAVRTSTIISLLLEITCVRLGAAAAAVILKDHLPRFSEHEITFHHPSHPT